MVGGRMENGMETSLRYSSHSKTLRIHAKEKLPLDSKTLIQAHGEIETGAGHPSFLAMSIRRFYPELSASVGIGFQFNKQDKFGYNIRAKKALALTSDGILGINVKGRCDTDKDFKQRNLKGAVELAWSILDFQKDQDVRIKLGYDLLEKDTHLIEFALWMKFLCWLIIIIMKKLAFMQWKNPDLKYERWGAGSKNFHS